MANNNNIIYPPNHRAFFDGGISNKFDVNLIPDNESPTALNCVTDDGAIATRLGIATMPSWVSDAVGSNICDGLFSRIDNTGTDALVSVWGGQIHAGEAATLLSEQPTSFVTNTRCTGAEYEGYLFIGQSGATPYKLLDDNSTLTRHGIPIAPDSMTVASGASGSTFASFTGDYSYKVTWVNSALVEGDVSTFTTTFNVASTAVEVTDIPTAPASYGVESRKLYRTQDGNAIWQLLTTISDNTTTTYTDELIEDDNLGAVAPTDQGEPPAYSVSIYHQGRLFVIDPVDKLVKYSELGNPYVFKATSFLRAGDTSSDEPISLDIYDNSLVILCRRNPYICYMGSTSETDWRILRVRSPYGTKSKFGSFRYNNKVMYPAVAAGGRFVGFAALEGQTVSPSASLLTNTALGSDLQSTRIEGLMKAVNEDLVEGITSFVYERKAYISVPLDITDSVGNVTEATENNRVLLFDFSMGRLDRKQEASWNLWDNCKFLTFCNYKHSSRSRTQLFGGPALATGQIREINVDGVYQDDGGTAIDSFYFTKRFAGTKKDENLHKDFRFALILHEISDTDQDLNFTYIVDGQSTGTTNVISLGGGADWGSVNWDEFQWSPSEGSAEKRSYIAPTFGKRIQFKFDNQNTANYHFKIFGFNFVYNRKGLR
jgi:hypothetical protein